MLTTEMRPSVESKEKAWLNALVIYRNLIESKEPDYLGESIGDAAFPGEKYRAFKAGVIALELVHRFSQNPMSSSTLEPDQVEDYIIGHAIKQTLELDDLSFAERYGEQ